jgi:hypothetical protein
MKYAYLGMLEPAASRYVTVKERDSDSSSSNHFRIVGVVDSTIHVEDKRAIM